MKFICDDNLGKLVKWLRVLGYNASYKSTISDSQLISQALKEDRIILTRDSKLIEFKMVKNYILIKSEKPIEQLRQVVKELKLKFKKNDLFTRCMICNQPLQKIEKKDIEKKVPPYVYKTQNDFLICSQCERIYWSGTHVQRMAQKLKENIEF